MNESAGLAPNAAPLYRDPAIYNEEILDTQGVRTYYGWELAPAHIPDVILHSIQGKRSHINVVISSRHIGNAVAIG